MPQKSKFGFIPPLELLKLWVDYGFWYVRQLALLQIHSSILAMGLRVQGCVHISLHGRAQAGRPWTTLYALDFCCATCFELGQLQAWLVMSELCAVC